MANYNNLKATINANIKANGNEEITGPILNTVLNQAVTALGAGYQYMGVATPATSPGTPDANVFYIATTAGTYTNFGSLVVADGEVVILKYNGYWTKEVTGAATAAQVTQLGQEVTDNSENIVNLQQEIDSIQPIIIEGNVTNAPDEEDITTDSNDLLKFADRPTVVNQMGYVILRKNKSFAEQVTQENTIYEIRYAFDLGGSTITLPNNVSFVDAGGKVSNGGFVFENAPMGNLPMEGISLIKREGNDRRDFSGIMPKISIRNGFFKQRNYLPLFNIDTIRVTEDVTVPISLLEITAKQIEGNGNLLTFQSVSNVITVSCSIIINNLRFEGTFDTSLSSNHRVNQFSFVVRNGENIRISHCSFKNFFLYVNNNGGTVTFENCDFENCCAHLDSNYSTDQNANGDILFDGCRFQYGEVNTDNTEIIHSTFLGWGANTKIVNCSFVNNYSSFSGHTISDMIDTYDGCNILISNCYFYAKNAGGGQGLIVIKSHSVSETGTGQDSLGEKYGVTISNNTFYIDGPAYETEIPPNARIVSANNLVRDNSTSEDGFFPRTGISISGNMITAKNVALILAYTVNSIEDMMIAGNHINCISGCKASTLWTVDRMDTVYGIKPNNITIIDNVVHSKDQLFRPFYFSSSFDSSVYANGFSNIVIRGNVIRTRYLSFDSDIKKMMRLLAQKQNCIISGNAIYSDGNNSLPYGPSTSRPWFCSRGESYYDTTLGKPIFRSSGVNLDYTWVDATGATV